MTRPTHSSRNEVIQSPRPQIGEEWSREYELTEARHRAFLEAFDDRNPLHVDDAHARERGFPGRVVHGAQLNGLLSHFVGMVLPQRQSLILSVELRYLKPSHVGDRVELWARLSQWTESQGVARLDVAFRRVSSGDLLARGKALVRLELEQTK